MDARAGTEGQRSVGVKWLRVVLDEAQTIKNAHTLVAKAAFRLTATYRWCLSGTPVQNSIDDLYSYFRFLRYRPYNDYRSFQEFLKSKILSKPTQGYKLLKAVLQRVLLRRTKSCTSRDGTALLGLPPKKVEVVKRVFSMLYVLRRTRACTPGDGTALLKLPPMKVEVVKRVFSMEEQEFYKSIQAEGLRQLKSGTFKYIGMLHQLLKLRQACNHPWLVKGTGKASFENTEKPSLDESEAARKLPKEKRDHLLSCLLKPLELCPICEESLEVPLVSMCAHAYCRQGITNRLEGSKGDAGAAASRIDWKLQEGMQCITYRLEASGGDAGVACNTCNSNILYTDLFSRSALEACQGAGTHDDTANGSARAVPSTDGCTRDVPSSLGSNPKTKNLVAEKEEEEEEVAWVSSSKVDQLLLLLNTVRARNMAIAGGGASTSACPSPAPDALPEKVIVFSQWTSMLNLLEGALKKYGYAFRRLDGTMTVHARERAIQDFENLPKVMVFLVSLKVGVNLTVANHVVLMDLWWNPSVEEQAIDRAHRIGQTRTVFVTRITIKGSVEERILELQSKKQRVVASVLSDMGLDRTESSGKLTMDDLRFLFGSSDF
eukprot:gene29290-12534_t